MKKLLIGIVLFLLFVYLGISNISPVANVDVETADASYVSAPIYLNGSVVSSVLEKPYNGISLKIPTILLYDKLNLLFEADTVVKLKAVSIDGARYSAEFLSKNIIRKKYIAGIQNDSSVLKIQTQNNFALVGFNISLLSSITKIAYLSIIFLTSLALSIVIIKTLNIQKKLLHLSINYLDLLSPPKEYIILGAIVLTAFIVRILFIFYSDNIMGLHMISDYSVVHKNALMPEIRVGHDPMYYYWAFYEIFVSILYKLIYPTMFVAQAFNALLSVASGLILYVIVKRISKSIAIALIISTLFWFFPAQIIYTTFLTGEYLCQFFLILSFLIFLNLYNCISKIKSIYWILGYSILLGLSLMTAEIFRPLAIVLLIAIVISLILFIMKNTFWKTCLTIFVLIGSFYCSKTLYFEGANVLIESGEKMHQKYNLTWNVLYFTLSTDNYMTSAQIKKSKEIFNKNRYDTKELKDATLEHLRNNWEKLPSLLAKKFVISWKNDSWACGWYSSSVKDKCVPFFSVTYVDSYYMFVFILILLGAVSLFKSRRFTVEYVAVIFFVLGIVSMFLLIEAQGRYKSPVIPIFMILITHYLVLKKSEINSNEIKSISLE